MDNDPSTSAQIRAFYRYKLLHSTGEYFPSSLLLVVTLLQTITTIILVGLFYIPYDVKLMSFCTISFTQMGFGQYNLIQLGLLIAGPIYICILCLEILFHRQSACLYVILLFEFWIVVFSSIQAYQHLYFIQEFSLCRANNQSNTQITNDNNGYMALPYGIAGTSCIGFLLLLIISIYHRKYFQLSMESLHSTLTSLLKLDAFLLFTYAIEIMPIPIITHSSSSITLTEIVLIYSFGFLLFLLSWSTGLVTRQYLPRWYIILHVILLGILCLTFIGYLCYRLIGFALETNSFILRVRYSLIFACLASIIVLLLTASLALKLAACQWKLKYQPHQQQQYIEHQIENKQPLQKEQEKNPNQNDSDDNELFLTPQVSRIV
ncbi:unnamed protein product [Cunninghamella echinulata]